MLKREVYVGQRLRFHALCGVHDQQRAFARGQSSADLVGKVHVAGRVDQVQLVGFAVLGFILHAHSLGFYSDPALAFQFHGVQDLLLHFALFEYAGLFEDPVRQRGLAVVDVRDDAEIADVR